MVELIFNLTHLKFKSEICLETTFESECSSLKLKKYVIMLREFIN